MNTDNKIRLRDHRLLGFRVNPGTIGDFIAMIDEAVTNGTKQTIFYHNLHSLYTYFTSAPLQRCYDKVTILVDGMPVIWLLKIMRLDATRDQRVTYVDFIWPMLEAANENNWRVFHVGQAGDVQQRALQTIRQRLPGISIEGHDGYFDQSPNSDESKKVIAQINQHETDILLVGFGAPKQEFWVDSHREQIDAATVFTCGACMEYVAGHVKTPPRWLARLGLEWSYRLLENPRRFAFRYLIEPLLLGLHLLRHVLAERSVSAVAQDTSRSPSDAKHQAGG